MAEIQAWYAGNRPVEAVHLGVDNNQTILLWEGVLSGIVYEVTNPGVEKGRVKITPLPAQGWVPGSNWNNEIGISNRSYTLTVRNRTDVELKVGLWNTTGTVAPVKPGEEKPFSLRANNGGAVWLEAARPPQGTIAFAFE